MTKLLDSRNGPAFDLVASSAPARTWIMASLPRSGSTFLCRTLWDTGGVGAPKEYLNPMQLRDWEVRSGPGWLANLGYRFLPSPGVGFLRGRRWSDQRLRAHIERVRARRSAANGWFGLKVHYHHFAGWFLDRGWAVDDIVGPVTWVRLRREDRLAQAVSWSRALQSGRWVADQRAILPAFYRPRQIRRLLAEIDRQEKGWDAFFEQNEIRPLTLSYEEARADLRGTVARVQEYLGLTSIDRERVAAPGLRPQSDEINESWMRRYAESHRPTGGEEVA